jgi:hypothetical protein
MNHPEKPIDSILQALQERAKELHCLYRVDEIVNRPDASIDDAFHGVAQALPAGWQFPDVCVARIVLGNRAYESAGFRESSWSLVAPILVQGEVAGRIEVHYTEAMPHADEGPFLKEERKLIDTVADRLGHLVARKQLERALEPAPAVGGEREPEWWVILSFLRQTDRALLARLGRKMVNYLFWNGVEEAERLLRERSPARAGLDDEAWPDNRPRPRAMLPEALDLADAAFHIAARHLPEAEILSRVQEWIKEEKSSFLKNALEHLDTPLADLADALQRFRHAVEEGDLPRATQVGLRAALVRRFLTEELKFVNVAKDYLGIADFRDLAQRIVYPPRSHGRLGGKSAGLVLAARIVARSEEYADVLGDIRIPRSWYVPSDGILDFIHHNDLEDVYNRKYMETDRIRQEYPHIVELFKSSSFSPEVLQGLSVVLDEFEDRPIIVRSSSLLEDRMGAAFSGKYKSLFLANRGGKRERLAALTDAIAEVYASVFSADPIEYRAKRGLLDLHEEMGILIQEVVGTRVGPYFLPVFSGVAFSNNEFRWSPRIRREDGLIRLVPGLGTRAVDRLADDYPILIAPGQPGLRINQTVDEALRYSPKKMDVINLETNAFETVDVEAFLKVHGETLPMVRDLVSVADGDRPHRPVGLIDFEKQSLIVDFEGLAGATPFIPRVRALLRVLREKLHTPVDIEFACDGRHVYLLQCRPQGGGAEAAPTPIPRDLPRDKVLFSANRYVSNGRVPDVSHVVYVDPEAYGALDPERIREVGRAVGRLNHLLPKRQFILMGPGRWGSRGDIRLGVPVTYADISNTAVLVEVARKKGGYLPDLSFGTHFFQDLVESQIRYLPLYPDDPDVLFNQAFLSRAPNALRSLLPEFAHLEGVLRVIDVPHAAEGEVLRVLMNAELDEAVGLIAPPGRAPEATPDTGGPVEARSDDPWRWRLRMAQRIADVLDVRRFAVKGLYVFGSTKNATAGPGSDIDLLVHFAGTDEQRRGLELWLQGWSLCLAEINYLRTGYKTEGLLDVHLVTDDDIARGESFASKIGAVTDAARPLLMGNTATA